MEDDTILQEETVMELEIQEEGADQPLQLIAEGEEQGQVDSGEGWSILPQKKSVDMFEEAMKEGVDRCEKKVSMSLADVPQQQQQQQQEEQEQQQHDTSLAKAPPKPDEEEMPKEDLVRYLKAIAAEQDADGAEEEGEEEIREKVTFTKMRFSVKPSTAPDDRKTEMRRRRTSIGAGLRRRKSLAAQRMDLDDMEGRISGDFTAADLPTFALLQPEKKLSIDSYHGDSESMIFEEEIPMEAEFEMQPIDRPYYYEMYKMLLNEKSAQKMKNNVLQKKMAEYFRKRKMEHVLKETFQQVDNLQKYNKRLDFLGELLELDRFQRTRINNDIKAMRDLRNEQRSKMNESFHRMQTRESEVGNGLIFTKTGKEIPEKVVERFLHRQKLSANQVASLRLKYIKIRDRVNEKQAKLRSLDEIAPGLHLIDYEQLKIENQSHADKIEERDEELTRLRFRCQNAIQCLAHLREKCAACEVDIETLKERVEDVEMESIECRERANFFKIDRDNYRQMTEKLIEETGLLTKPKLLLDMEDALAESKVTENELFKLQQEHDKNGRRLKGIRQSIEHFNKRKWDRDKKLLDIKDVGDDKDGKGSKGGKGNKLYKGRPTLICPQLPDLASRQSSCGTINFHN